MTPRSAVHTVFATPELAFLISEYLSQHDLAQCARVNKDWMHQHEPYLYTTLCLREPHGLAPSSPVTRGLIRNLHHLRTVDLCVARDRTVMQELARGLPQCPHSAESALDLNRLCTNVRQFKFICGFKHNFDLTQPHLITLLNHNRFLTHLTIPLINTEVDIAILTAVSELRHLQSLTVVSCESTGRRTISVHRQASLLLRACLPLPKLSDLKIDLDIIRNDGTNDKGIPDLDTIINEATTTRFSGNPTACKIKALQLSNCPESERFPLTRPLLKSDLLDLESFTTPSSSWDLNVLSLEQVIREHCPNLKHVRCALLHGGQNVRAVIRGCSGLKRFTSNDFFSDQDDDYEPRLIIQDLVGYHCDTLEEITLENCNQIFSADIQLILTQCKQLKRLWVQSSYPNGRAGIEFTDLSMSDWACTELKALGLTLNRYPNDEDSDLDEEDPGLMALDGERFYRQIGRLGKLEELALDIDRSEETMCEEADYAWDLTLSKGWLGELRNLKNLKRLELNANFWSKMGQAEVEFMHDQWPLLNEVSLQGQVSQQRFQAHWQWLFKKRPRLLFTTEER
ncbi:hypothetical protein EC968_000277 [Mortierella alpina]|nr:hypothetical protein EC968_000277 [Mortierella alpina]